MLFFIWKDEKLFIWSSFSQDAISKGVPSCKRAFEVTKKGWEMSNIKYQQDFEGVEGLEKGLKIETFANFDKDWTMEIKKV